MPEVLRLGFAGLGEAATRVLPEICELPYIKLTAAADLRRHALDRFSQEFEAEGFDSFEEMCQSPHVDAVYVATPHELHAEHTIMALRNRKHVIVEKPMALSIEDCERMNAAADEYGVKLMCGHTHSFDPPIRKMKQIIDSGDLGPLRMINTWTYKSFMVGPYTDADLGATHGIILNQGPHQVDIVRLLGGGLVRSVRAMTGQWDDTRPEGAYVCYLEFEDGVPASLVMSGYGFFNASELSWWVGEGGQPVDSGTHARARQRYNAMRGPRRAAKLEALHEQMRYGAQTPGQAAPSQGWEAGRQPTVDRVHQKFFGLTIVSCEKGEMRQSADGILIYGDGECSEVPIGEMLVGRQAEVAELYEAVVNGRPMFHDGRWGEATLEVCLGLIQSAAERKEIYLSHQVPAQ